MPPSAWPGAKPSHVVELNNEPLLKVCERRVPINYGIVRLMRHPLRCPTERAQTVIGGGYVNFPHRCESVD